MTPTETLQAEPNPSLEAFEEGLDKLLEDYVFAYMADERAEGFQESYRCHEDLKKSKEAIMQQARELVAGAERAAVVAELKSAHQGFVKGLEGKDELTLDIMQPIVDVFAARIEQLDPTTKGQDE